MIHIDDIVEPRLLAEMRRLGYVKVQQHPTQNLVIGNYSDRAVIDGIWNEATRRCRGLIWNPDTGSVHARPLPKFFNHGQAGAPTIHEHTPVTVTDKADGSLGIVYRDQVGNLNVATRGSFTSDQALHATRLLGTRYGDWSPLPGITYLFEIIYPENRIVLDYEGLDDLVLLGGVDIETGKTFDAHMLSRSRRPWPGPVVETMPYRTFGEALAAPPRDNREGLVVHDHITDERIKIKYAEYVRLHRLVTNLTSRRVHDLMVEGVPVDDICAPMPDEFHDWIRQVHGDILDEVAAAERVIAMEWRQAVAGCEENSPESGPQAWPFSVSMGIDTGRVLTREQRALFAAHAKKKTYGWALFSMLDGRDVKPTLLKNARPEIETPNGRSFTEATA